MKIVNHIKNLLEQNSKFCKEGKLFKNVVVEAGLKLDSELLTILLADETAKETFFTEVNNIAVFDKVKFQKFISNKQFLPDSYTAFKNKIGLTANGEYLTEANEVVLNFPYKDCVLEGGQTKDDQKRQEIFWNETLAPDEIDRLFEPKVLTNWKRIRKGSNCGKIKEETPQKLERETDGTLKDNLIIKGNNLIALHSLKKIYKGKVKLIYIDPPYNTGNDSFNYNDSFNHSTWLTFMKNRLEVARELLKDDGVIFVQCDDNEQAYLKVLMDGVFGRENLVANFIWNHRKSSQNDIDVSLSHNYTLTFAKKRQIFKLNALEIDNAKFSNPDNDIRGNWVADPFDAPSIRENLSYEIVNPITGASFYPPAGRHWRMSKEKYEAALNDNRIVFGKTGKTKPQCKRFESEAQEKGINSFTIWDFVDTATKGTKELMKLFDGRKFTTPKPEKLLQRIIHISTQPNDIVLDYHLGSGTTCAVAHKMGRRYIGIEQMDYIEDIAVERLKKVIDGEQGGVSKNVDWQGGGNFVYTELAKDNAVYIDKVEKEQDGKTLINIWNEIKDKPFISYKVNPQDIDENISDFENLDLDDQKKVLISLLDKNQMYVNLSEIESTDHSISEEDKSLNQLFYK